MDDPPFPKTRDVLLNQLNSKIKYLQPDLAEKILTTLALDKSNQEIIDLLINDALLEEKVDNIVLIIDEDKREALGSKLFQSISQIEQELSAQVTGMLLELPFSVINRLLTNPNDLEKAVLRAKSEFLAYLKNGEQLKTVDFPPTCVETLPDLPLRKEHVGELLYEKLSPIYPYDAPKLTGMLLQMPSRELEALLVDDQLLMDKVEAAFTALEEYLQ